MTAISWLAKLKDVPLAAAERVLAGRRLPAPLATPLDRLLERGVKVMWVGAHPDDESFAGPVLAKAWAWNNPLYFLVLTHGEGGDTGDGDDAAGGRAGVAGGGGADLATRRAAEMAKVARLYGAKLEMERFWNAPLPVDSFPPRHEIARRWLDYEDPEQVIRRAILEFRPDVVLTFAPDYGATGHPEHQLTSRFTTQAVRNAARLGGIDGAAPHIVPHVYYVAMRYWFLRLAGMLPDPIPFTERFPAHQLCPDGRTCAQIMAANTLPHETQKKDMGMMRAASHLLQYTYLYRVDPFHEIKDPLEPSSHGGMGV